MRILLYLATNFAVVVLIALVMSLFGEPMLAQNGIGINLTGLLISSAIFGFVSSLFSLFISKWMAKRAAQVKLIQQPTNGTEQWLLDTVSALANKASIGMPEVGIFPSSQPNAFATGWNKNSALVAVSAGLLERMDKREIRAVLAHEVAHVANGDMVTLSLIQGVVNTFVIFFSRIIGMLVDRVIFKNQRGYGPGYYISSIAAQIVLGILASAIVMWFSRYREFRADEGGASMAGTDAMIAALEALKGGSSAENTMPENLEAFGIGSGKRAGMRALFASHPPLDDRIAVLRTKR